MMMKMMTMILITIIKSKVFLLNIVIFLKKIKMVIQFQIKIELQEEKKN